MSEKIIPIPARLKNVSRGGHVAGAEDIIDDSLQKTLAELNLETNAAIEALYGDTLIIVSELPASGVTGKIYRVPGTGSYTDYMWDASLTPAAFVELATYTGGSEGDFFNVNAYNNVLTTPYQNAAEARGYVPSGVRKQGLLITYLLAGGWFTDQYIGTATDSASWATASNWKPIGPVSVSQNISTGKEELSIGGDVKWILDNEPEAGSNNLVKSGGVYKSLLYQIKKESGTTTSIGVFSTGVELKKGNSYQIYFKSDSLVSGSSDDGIWIKVGNSITQVLYIQADQLYAGYTYNYVPTDDCLLYLRIRQIGVGYTYIIRGLVTEGLVENNDNTADLISKFWGTYASAAGISKVTQLITLGISLKANNTYNIYSKTATQITTADSDIGLWINDGSVSQIVTFTPAQLYQGISYIYTPANDCILYLRTKQIGVEYEVNVLSSFPVVSEDINKRVKDLETNTLMNQWAGKNVVVYGDSITAQGNGDNPTNNAFLYWAKQFYKFANLYVRGVGGQTYMWNTYGWYTKVGTNGNYLDRFNYDAQGNKLNTVVSPLTTTAEEIANIEAKYNATIEIHYGAFCSWDRIKAMIPSTIRETIDLVIICGGTNDFNAVEEVEVEGDMSAAEPIWIPNDTTDTIWGADTTYYKGGDYDITTFSGAIASAVMKMQVWCPNAVVVVATPFALYDTTTKQQKKNTSNLTFRRMCEIQKYVVENISANVIDANAKCEITGVVFNDYVEDGVHPNLAGRKKYGAVFVGEIGRIGVKIE